MNERIKELAEQAEMAANNGDHVDVKIMMEKFAELIVEECAKVCRDLPNIYADKVDRDNCAIAIEEHFGVEE